MPKKKKKRNKRRDDLGEFDSIITTSRRSTKRDNYVRREDTPEERLFKLKAKQREYQLTAILLCTILIGMLGFIIMLFYLVKP